MSKEKKTYSISEILVLTLFYAFLMSYLSFLIYIFYLPSPIDSIFTFTRDNLSPFYCVLFNISIMFGFYPISMIFYKVVEFLFYPETLEQKEYNKLWKVYKKGTISRNEWKKRKKKLKIENLIKELEDE